VAKMLMRRWQRPANDEAVRHATAVIRTTRDTKTITVPRITNPHTIDAPKANQE